MKIPLLEANLKRCCIRIPLKHVPLRLAKNGTLKTSRRSLNGRFTLHRSSIKQSIQTGQTYERATHQAVFPRRDARDSTLSSSEENGSSRGIESARRIALPRTISSRSSFPSSLLLSEELYESSDESIWSRNSPHDFHDSTSKESWKLLPSPLNIQCLVTQRTCSVIALS